MHTFGLFSLLFGVFLLGCQSSDSSSQDREVIATDDAPEAIGPYSQAIRVDDTIYCSGQVGIDPETGDLVDGGIEAETRQVLDNIDAVLEAAGASRDDIVRTQVFLADLGDYDAMNDVYSSYFEAAPPARAAVEAGGLPAGAQVEIMVTARR